LNSLLLINKKLVLFVSFIFVIIISLFILIKFYLSSNFYFEDIKIDNTNIDIVEPKFSINNSKNKIFITAKEGNFINEDEILLKKNVVFKSDKFTISSDNVIFDKKKLTAKTKRKSEFTSKKTKIFSNGFDISDNGDKIIFNGKSKILIK